LQRHYSDRDFGFTVVSGMGYFCVLRSIIKWFKHDSDAFTSEGVEALIDAEGFSGYGRWCRLLEIVAFKMDETDRCGVEYPIQKWCSLLKLKQKKLISFLEVTQNQLKTKVTRVDNQITIEIPNLLKKRDKYSNDLRKKGKLLTSREVEVEVEVEVDKEKSKPIVCLGKNPKQTAIGILEFLNSKRPEKRGYRPTDVNLGFIIARLKEGYVEQEFKSVIAMLFRKWKGTEMEQYFRPATLFNREKFNQYVGNLGAETKDDL